MHSDVVLTEIDHQLVDHRRALVLDSERMNALTLGESRTRVVLGGTLERAVPLSITQVRLKSRAIVAFMVVRSWLQSRPRSGQEMIWDHATNRLGVSVWLVLAAERHLPDDSSGSMARAGRAVVGGWLPRFMKVNVIPIRSALLS